MIASGAHDRPAAGDSEPSQGGHVVAGSESGDAVEVVHQLVASAETTTHPGDVDPFTYDFVSDAR